LPFIEEEVGILSNIKLSCNATLIVLVVCYNQRGTQNFIPDYWYSYIKLSNGSSKCQEATYINGTLLVHQSSHTRNTTNTITAVIGVESISARLARIGLLDTLFHVYTECNAMQTIKSKLYNLSKTKKKQSDIKRLEPDIASHCNFGVVKLLKMRMKFTSLPQTLIRLLFDSQFIFRTGR